ncbi:hypothetical protein LBMAG23_08680 [Bacteroidota bacterium]|nr:hypothetical protein LBMAG23_08680 [Bacteroidota bacterium]
MEEQTWHQKYHEQLSFGERLSDTITKVMGSWQFIIWQTLIVLIWMILNIIGFVHHWDVYPFVLLNLIFSTQAAYAAPIIMMSQNRQNQRDREQALHDYQVNIAAKKEIEDIQRQLSKIEVDKLDKILQLLRENKA